MQIVQHYITALINLAVRNAFENINKYKQLDYTTDASRTVRILNVIYHQFLGQLSLR